MRRVLALTSLLFLFACGVSQDEFEGIDGVWKLDSVSCFTSIGDASTQEVWAVESSPTVVTLGITGRDISMTVQGASTPNDCTTSKSYSLKYIFTEREGLKEGKLDYQLYTSNPQACTLELNYYNGTNVDTGTKYNPEIVPTAANLYNRYFQRVDDNTLLLQLPSEVKGSAAGLCAGNCECYGAFVPL